MKLQHSQNLLSTEILSLASLTWTSGPTLPEPVTNGQAFAYNGTIYALSPPDTGFLYKEGVWKKVSPKTKKRVVFPAIIVNKAMLGC